MNSFFFALLAALGLATQAVAITVNPGEIYEGNISFGPENVQPADCCPVIDGTLKFNSLQQYNIVTSSMVVGTTFTAKLIQANGDEFASVTWGPTSFFYVGGVGLGLGLFGPVGPDQPADAKLRLSVDGAPVRFDEFDVAVIYDAMVQHPTLGPIATNLQSSNPVTDLALVVVDPVDPIDPIDPVDPIPSPIPLPAPLLLLGASILTLRGLKKV